MKKTFTFITAAALICCGRVGAQELLTNGNLDEPGVHETDVATGWTLTEGPGLINSATFASFANHTPSGSDPTQVGVWLRGFEGTTFDNPRPAADADLTQTVPGTAGGSYMMSGWARFETHWSGGLDLLPSGGTTSPPRWPANTPSPTRTEFALEFLDAANVVLGGSVVVDLHDDRGQTNDGLWHRHFLLAVAPAGTINVRVRGSMIDGVASDLNPQSAFFDDFSLTTVPEPGTLGLAACALAGLAFRRRQGERV
jgi:hypothetical protein